MANILSNLVRLLQLPCHREGESYDNRIQLPHTHAPSFLNTAPPIPNTLLESAFETLTLTIMRPIPIESFSLSTSTT